MGIFGGQTRRGATAHRGMWRETVYEGLLERMLESGCVHEQSSREPGEFVTMKDSTAQPPHDSTSGDSRLGSSDGLERGSTRRVLDEVIVATTNAGALETVEDHR